MTQLENIIQWNCNGIKCHYMELKEILLSKNPFCICIQETHLKKNENFTLRKYNSFKFSTNRGQRANGGVAIFIKENINVEEVNLNTNLQAVAIKVNFPYKMTICNIYLPDNQWTSEDLQDVIEQLPAPILLLGDFNSHNILWGSEFTDRRGRNIEHIINELNLNLLNTGEGTFINSRSNSLSKIDLSICSPSLQPKIKWNVLDEHNTDHIPIIIEFADRIIYEHLPQKWLPNRANWDQFRNLFDGYTPVIDVDINQLVKDFSDGIITAASESVPKSKSSTQIKKVPWWNTKIAEAVKEKKRAFNIFKRLQTNESMIRFKQLRAKARQLIVQSKRKSWQEYVNSINSNTNSKEIWQKIRNIIGRTFTLPSPQLIVNNSTISNPYDIANELANHFQIVSETVHIETENNEHIDFNTNEQLLYNLPLQLEELEHVLVESKSSAPGNDQIIYEFIKQLPEKQKKYLLDIYNKIWNNHTYPTQWRQAIVLPFPKAGKNSETPSNYRPISLTCCLSKILEKMVSQRLLWELEKRKLLTEFQMGFRKNRSTNDQLVLLEDAIQNAFSRRNHLVAVFFDLEKAFDQTWRLGILKTIHKWNFRGNLPIFIKNFLEERTFNVKIQETLSNTRSLKNGIPQGSTLSVVLFAIAVNELTNVIEEHVGKSIYVDDLLMYYESNKIEDIEQTLQRNINNLNNYASRNGFTFSKEKTHCIHFCRLRTPHREPRLLLGNQLIEIKESTKLLGVIYDKKLYWKEHIQNTTKKCKKYLNILKSISSINWGCDYKSLLMFYKSFILARIDYGSIVYSSARKSTLKPLDSIQREALSIALGAYRTSPYLSLCSETSVPPLNYRRDYLLTSYYSKILSQPDHPVHKIFSNTSEDEIYNRRSTITRPARIRYRELLENLNETPPHILSNQEYEIAPWILNNTKLHNECLKYKKEETPQDMIKQEFLNIINKYQNKQIIYTDGSKTTDRTSSAIYVESLSYSWTLTSVASVYTAELYAIWQALKYIDLGNNTVNIICSDSLSSLQALQNKFNQDPMIKQINATLHYLESTGKSISFIWVPSHIGITGNESADKAAKEALNHLPENIPIRADDLKTYLKQKILTQWQEYWSQNQSKLNRVKNTTKPWTPPEYLQRREQAILSRLRIGHTRYTSSYMLCGENQPNCDMCRTTITVDHILIECPKYENKRRELALPQNIELCLTNNFYIKKCINFLKEINLFQEI